MFLVSISFRAQPHKRSELLSAVDDTVTFMRRSTGCERCRVLVDCDDQNAFVVSSEWRLSADAERFLESRQFQMFRGARILLRDDATVVLDDVRNRAIRTLAPR